MLESDLLEKGTSGQAKVALALSDYKFRGISGISYINFAKFFSDVIRLNREDSNLVVDAEIPSATSSRLAGASTAIGGVLAAAIGLGWRKGTGGAILLKNCPIELITIGEYDQWAKIRCLFRVPQAKYGEASISAKMEGWFSSRRAAVLKFKGQNVPGFEQMEKDQNLADRVLSLFQSKLVLAFREFRPEILIRFEKRNEGQFGIVESGMQRCSSYVEGWEKKLDVSYAQVAHELFDVAKDLVSRITTAASLSKQ
jgi:hypothetical protein